MMQDVRNENVRVSIVMPGSVATDLVARPESGEAAGKDWKIWPEDVAGNRQHDPANAGAHVRQLLSKCGQPVHLKSRTLHGFDEPDGLRGERDLRRREEHLTKWH